MVSHKSKLVHSTHQNNEKSSNEHDLEKLLNYNPCPRPSTTGPCHDQGSHKPLTTEARIRAWISPCGICSGQRGAETGFSQEFFGFLLSVTMPLHTCISPGG
jgi:hypothetical protein